MRTHIRHGEERQNTRLFCLHSTHEMGTLCRPHTPLGPTVQCSQFSLTNFNVCGLFFPRDSRHGWCSSHCQNRTHFIRKLVAQHNSNINFVILLNSMYNSVPGFVRSGGLVWFAMPFFTTQSTPNFNGFCRVRVQHTMTDLFPILLCLSYGCGAFGSVV